MSYNNQGKSSVGNLNGNFAGLLSYALGWITGLIFFLLEKDNKFVKFHAAQSLILFLSITIISMLAGIVPFIGYIINTILNVITLVCWIIGMIKAYNNEYFKFPIVGDIAAGLI